jgi:hypothetical protein
MIQLEQHDFTFWKSCETGGGDLFDDGRLFFPVRYGADDERKAVVV